MSIQAQISVDGCVTPLRAIIRVSSQKRYFINYGLRGRGSTVAYLQGNPREGFRLTREEAAKILAADTESLIKLFLEKNLCSS